MHCEYTKNIKWRVRNRGAAGPDGRHGNGATRSPSCERLAWKMLGSRERNQAVTRFTLRAVTEFSALGAAPVFSHAARRALQDPDEDGHGSSQGPDRVPGNPSDLLYE